MLARLNRLPHRLAYLLTGCADRAPQGRYAFAAASSRLTSEPERSSVLSEDPHVLRGGSLAVFPAGSPALGAAPPCTVEHLLHLPGQRLLRVLQKD